MGRAAAIVAGTGVAPGVGVIARGVGAAGFSGVGDEVAAFIAASDCGDTEIRAAGVAAGVGATGAGVDCAVVVVAEGCAR